MPDAPASWITRRRIGPPPDALHAAAWPDVTIPASPGVLALMPSYFTHWTNPLGEPGHCLGRRAADQNRKLVAPEPAHRVFLPATSGDRITRLAQQVVSDFSTMDRIDRTHVIDIRDQTPQWPPAPAGDGQIGLQTRLEITPPKQAGQFIHH